MRFSKQGFLFNLHLSESGFWIIGQNCWRKPYCEFVPEVKEILDNCFVDFCKPTIEECVMLDLTHGDGNAKVWCSMLRELKSNKQSFLLPSDETFKGSYTRAFIDDYIKIPEGY